MHKIYIVIATLIDETHVKIHLLLFNLRFNNVIALNDYYHRLVVTILYIKTNIAKLRKLFVL